MPRHSPPRSCSSAPAGFWRSVSRNQGSCGAGRPRKRLALAGARAAARLLALPAEVSIDGQVIARWAEEGSDDETYWCLALDDGERAWTFDVGRAAFGQFPLGARIRTRIAPRSMRLLDLAMVGPEGEIPPAEPRGGQAAGTGPGPWATRPR